MDEDRYYIIMAGDRYRNGEGAGGPPQTTMRYMPLADIFIGAIACLLILIVVARQTREQVNKIPQADLVYVCSSTSEGVFLRPKVSKKAGQLKSFSLSRFEAALRIIDKSNKLSVRLLVYANEKDSKVCFGGVKKIVKKLNRVYETPGKRSRSSVYLLLDTAPLLENQINGGNHG